MPSTAGPTDEELRRLLSSAKTIAVVGLSENPFRPSHGVALYLRQAGYRIIPINPNLAEVLGERSFPDLRAMAAAGIRADLIDVFRDPATVGPLVDDAISIGAPAIWFQEGVVNEAAAAKARAAGIRVVMDRCTMKDHARLVP